MQHYIPTGNEFVSLPKLNELNAGIEDVTLLSMQYKGMIDIRGGRNMPLIVPFVKENGEEVPITDMVWTREHYWIPTMKGKAGKRTVKMTVLAPIGERGFVIRMELSGRKDGEVVWGIKGKWESSYHCINEDKKLEGTVHCYRSGWNFGIVFDFRCGAPMFSFAPMCDELTDADFEVVDNQITYTLAHTDMTEKGKTNILHFYWGFGYEEVASTTSAKEMLRRGFDYCYKKTAKYLDARTTQMPTEKLSQIYNTNLFFCRFFATGLTLDTEELTCMTSRSTRYYVSAAYWDRDVLLWAYPAILDADLELSGEILRYVFGRQRRNIGIHSHYIDGTLLEPGFELDELMAPVVSLYKYIKAGGDRGILEEENTKKSIVQILRTLVDVKHEKYDLYETFLQPTDDEIVYPYLTYDNMLVWYGLKALSELYPEKYAGLAGTAEKVKKAIYEHCVYTNEEGKKYFAWSVDLKGECNVYDEPPGSLQILPYFGFCPRDDEIWKNTLDMIRSPSYHYSFANSKFKEIGCAHANHPWILSFSNSMLSGHYEQAFAELEDVKMDNGIACESVNEDTGECSSGAAFATCAGFLCHAMKYALDEMNGKNN